MPSQTSARCLLHSEIALECLNNTAATSFFTLATSTFRVYLLLRLCSARAMALTSRALGSPAQTRQSKGKRVLTRRVGATRTKAVSQEVVWGVSAAGLGVGVGVGLPILFSKLEVKISLFHMYWQGQG